jgi:cell division protein FtsI (penicillin-binding protein 3)
MRRSFQTNRSRLVIAKILFFLVFIIVGGRAFQPRSCKAKDSRLGERQHLKEWIVLPKRGTVLDRAGEPLALSLESQSVYARPRRIQDMEAVRRSLANILNLNVAEVNQKITSDKPFVWIKRQITPLEAEQIQALNVDGVGMFYEPNRYYPRAS